MRIIVEYQRRFEMWRFSVTHKHLLLRANKSESDATRVEVLFANVKVINLPTLLDGLTISELSTDEAIRQYSEVISSLYMKNSSVFVLSGKGYSGYVVAGAVYMEEDQKEYYDTSMLE